MTHDFAPFYQLCARLQHSVRAAWRLKNQADDARAGRAPRIPPHMLATFDEVKQGFRYFLAHCNAHEVNLANQSDVLLHTEDFRASIGCIDRWVEPGCPSLLDGSWMDLLRNLHLATRFMQQNNDDSANEQAILAYDWETASRSAITISFVCRAFEAISEAVRDGSLPPNCRVRQLIKPDSKCLQYQIRTVHGSVLGEAQDLDGAIRDAMTTQASLNKPHEITLKQFQSTTTVIEVARGKVKLGSARPTTDLDQLAKLQAMITAAYGRVVRARPEDFPAPAQTKDKWIRNAMSTVLKTPFGQGADLHSLNFPYGGHLLMVRQGMSVSTGTIAALHRRFVQDAVSSGEMVPERVLRDYPDLATPVRQDDSVDRRRVAAPAHG